MEMGLLPVSSDLIDLIESPLLETVSNVNDDEDVVMADDLLDLELDAMIFSQFTRSQVVSRVPYKKICDSQTSNSRSSLELCCKDQTRSNNDSTLLTDTCSPSPMGMPPLEMVWDPEPTAPTSSRHHLPQKLEQKTCWMTPETEQGICHYCGEEDNVTCRLCQQHFTTPPTGCGSTSRSTLSLLSARVESLATTAITYYDTNAL